MSNAAGRPLARTVKLILDPLVLRPVLNPAFAAGTIAIEHVDALRRQITRAGPVLAATAAWFVVLKKERRRAGITDGNPQDLYFQRCYELASEHGHPQPDVSVAAVLAEIHGQDGPTMAQLREFVTDPGTVDELAELLAVAWARPPVRPSVASVRPGSSSPPARPARTSVCSRRWSPTRRAPVARSGWTGRAGLACVG
ncbi:hypothetical protein GCM10029964_095420 [Kibdelosporangium lantanae]